MNYIDKLIERKPNLKNEKDNILNFYKCLLDCYKSNHKVLICGNGGSASDSAHITGELMKGFVKKRQINEEIKNNINNVINNLSKDIKDLDENQKTKEFYDTLEIGLPTIDLTSFTSLNTAFCNDKSAEYMYANAVLGFGNEGDSLIAISTSGNSKNVLNACIVAKSKNMNVLFLTGKDGGNIKYLADVVVTSPENETYLIQEDHISIYHSLCLQIEEDLFK